LTGKGTTGSGAGSPPGKAITLQPVSADGRSAPGVAQSGGDGSIRDGTLRRFPPPDAISQAPGNRPMVRTDSPLTRKP